ncbi:unnamed protein product [Rhizophagus irregularis]|nr:unnamed protein product [Rhizophagus irregularis]CAB5383087.1 unnamed protein product [Rhizophagus irregularis]
MMSRGAWSRAIAPPMEISDISEEESMNYLIEKPRRSIEVIKKQKLIEIEQKFSSAKFLKRQKYHEIGKRAINALLDSKEININIFIDFFENNDEECEEYQEVLGANVFAYHLSSNTVTFQSRSVEFYIRENSNLLGLGDNSNSNRTLTSE